MDNTTLLAQINKQNINPTALAKNLMKNSIDVEEAIVNILSTTGIAGFRFHIPESEQLRMQSDITDHYTDINTPIQDHIARKPIRITLNGLHGEYFYSVNQVQDMVSKVAPTLALVNQFLPKLSDATKQIKAKYNESLKSADFYNASLDKETSKFQKFGTALTTLNGVDLFKIFQDVYKLKSAQTRAFLYFEYLWKANHPFSVETSVKRYDNMVIEDLQPKRDKNADIIDFIIIFKKIEITTSKVETIRNAAGRLKEQIAEVTQKGLDKGQEVDTLNPNQGG